MLKANTGDILLDEEIEDFIDVLLSRDSKLLKESLSFYKFATTPLMVKWIMDPVHFNVIQGLLIDNFGIECVSPRKTAMGNIDSHCGTSLPATHVELYNNWIGNILKKL